jgi:fructose-1,6-bisphosphatase/inositol monophosphatase family enzyme
MRCWLPRREDRDAVLGRGEAGDDTTVVDARAEAAVLRRFEDVSVVSEEVGEIERGTTVAVIDPIDGSINAKRLIPFSTSSSVTSFDSARARSGGPYAARALSSTVPRSRGGRASASSYSRSRRRRRS